MSNWVGVILFRAEEFVGVSEQQHARRRFAEFQPHPLGYEFQEYGVMVSFHLDAQNRLSADVQLVDLIDRLAQHLNDGNLHVSSFSTEERQAPSTVKSKATHTFFVVFKDKRSTAVRACGFGHWGDMYYRFADANDEQVAEFRRADVEAILRADSIYGSPPTPGLLSSKNVSGSA